MSTCTPILIHFIFQGNIKKYDEDQFNKYKNGILKVLTNLERDVIEGLNKCQITKGFIDAVRHSSSPIQFLIDHLLTDKTPKRNSIHQTFKSISCERCKW